MSEIRSQIALIRNLPYSINGVNTKICLSMFRSYSSTEKVKKFFSNYPNTLLQRFQISLNAGNSTDWPIPGKVIIYFFSWNLRKNQEGKKKKKENIAIKVNRIWFANVS